MTRNSVKFRILLWACLWGFWILGFALLSGGQVTSYTMHRFFMASVIGAVLAGCGMVMQVVTLNPLAEPYVLGMASSSALSAVMAATLFRHWPWASALGVSVLVNIVLFYPKKSLLSVSPLRRLTQGLLLNLVSASALTLWMAFAESGSLKQVTFWLLGDLSQPQTDITIVLAGLTVLGAIGVYRQGSRLDLLYFGHELAQGAGPRLVRLQSIVILGCAVITAFAVFLSGMIGFIGLLVPHFVRKFWGHQTRAQVLPTLFAGTSLLSLGDGLAHRLAYPVELPVGAVTAVVGGPLLWILLRKNAEEVR